MDTATLLEEDYTPRNINAALVEVVVRHGAVVSANKSLAMDGIYAGEWSSPCAPSPPLPPRTSLIYLILPETQIRVQLRLRHRHPLPLAAHMDPTRNIPRRVPTAQVRRLMEIVAESWKIREVMQALVVLQVQG
ncbi:hypothetical protein FIBSPDRAFT_855180, partial [Athelia psychrophila]